MEYNTPTDIVLSIPELLNLVLDYLPDIRVAVVNWATYAAVHAHSDYTFWSKRWATRVNIYRYGLPKMLELVRVDPRSALNEAIEYGNIRMVKHLHRQGVDIGHMDDYAVRHASEYGQLEIVKYLHKHGADIYAKGGLAFLNAVVRGHLPVVRYLHGVGAILQDRVWGSTITWAASNGHLHIVRYLHENGDDIHANGNAPLNAACRCGHLAVVRYLHEQGVDIRRDNDYALAEAAGNGNFEIVLYLHGAGADPAAQGGSAMNRALGNGHVDVVEYLYTNGAAATLDCEYVKEAVMGWHTEVLLYLRQQGIDVIDEIRQCEPDGRVHYPSILGYLRTIGVAQDAESAD